MERDSMKDPDWRQRDVAKTIEYPPCFRVDKPKRGVDNEQPGPSSRNASAPSLKEIRRYPLHARQQSSPFRFHIDQKSRVDAAPSFTSSQERSDYSDWTPASESTRESLLLRRLNTFTTSESSSKRAESPDPFVSLFLRRDSTAAKLSAFEKPVFRAISQEQYDQVVATNYPDSIAFSEANDKGEYSVDPLNNHVVEESKTDKQYNDPIDGSDDISLNLPNGDFDPEEKTWMAEFFEDSEWKEEPRFEVETVSDQDVKRQQLTHVHSRKMKGKGLEKDENDPDNQDSYVMKMLRKFLSWNTAVATENSITLLPRCIRATSCFSGDRNTTPESVGVTTSESLMKMVGCLIVDGDRHSYEIVDAYELDRIHSMRSCSSTSFSSSTSSSLSTSTQDSFFEKYFKEEDTIGMVRQQGAVSHEENTKPSADLTHDCNGSNDTTSIRDRMIQFRSMGTNSDNRDDHVQQQHRKEYYDTINQDTSRNDITKTGINAFAVDQPPSCVHLPKGSKKKWYRKLVQARQLLLLSRQQHQYYLQSVSSTSS
jgi:hypothetical protein